MLCLHVCIPSTSLRERECTFLYYGVSVCLSFCPLAFEGPTEAPLSTRHCKKRPSLPLAPTLPTWNLNLSPPGSQAKVFLPVCVSETRCYTAWAVFLPLKLCPPHQGAHLSACMKTGAQQGAALLQRRWEGWCWILSLTLLTEWLPSHEKWSIFKGRTSGSVTTGAAEAQSINNFQPQALTWGTFVSRIASVEAALWHFYAHRYDTASGR